MGAGRRNTTVYFNLAVNALSKMMNFRRFAEQTQSVAELEQRMLQEFTDFHSANRLRQAIFGRAFAGESTP